MGTDLEDAGGLGTRCGLKDQLQVSHRLFGLACCPAGVAETLATSTAHHHRHATTEEGQPASGSGACEHRQEKREP